MKLLAALTIALSTAVLAAPAQAAPRVAALTPFSASTITRLGVRPVVLGQTLGGSDQYIASLKGVPVLTLTHPLGPNLEQLATYNPSIVLSSKTWQRGTPAMRKLGMKVYESDPNSVAAVGTETRNIGKVLGRTRAADDLANKIANDVAAAKRNIRSRPRVLVILGVGRTPYAMLANSWGGDVVAQAGGTLLTQGLTSPSGTARISDEIVVKRNPDIIIAVPHGSPGNIPRLAAYYRNNPNWRNTKAVKNKRVYVATGNSLLQPYPGVASTIRDVRSKFLKN
ncbi:ABC transporter substrate-binding protein [Solirubrobacter ginsenosidimutans]|uniref:ABC transporter substrate-binding protein n=1 Tax=Solirubrobacter ginsenosidimutans TaxID=490573 RepID=A0A9X3MVI7_9ACTN|nr:ABC transporter substrate-binding protein [Solirubrobacter ginsenosidimutans]MDA0163182.1 ABC transporter substrate-binding protein [Solirubrobacter ginsenosidimutans]